MVNWQQFKIVDNIGKMATYTTLQIDGCVDYYDKKGSQYIFCDSAPFAYWKEGQRIEVDVDRLKYRKHRDNITREDGIIMRIGSFDYYSDILVPDASVRNAMINASSTNPTALAVTREGMDRVDRNKEREFEYKMEDSGGNKHHWTYRRR